MTTVKGIGTDIVKISRVEELVSRYGDRFLKRLFLPAEISYCQPKKRPAIHFAARFAAKEAMLKALGTGLSQGISWKDMEVCRQPGAAPEFSFSGRVAELCRKRGITGSLISLSHEQEFALAFVIITGDP
ncbi:MAG: holo-ACP synthase [Deltaproteobacteria bacterium]|nr:holo-ACP synthase [Deltaproteobacteria bacterium]